MSVRTRHAPDEFQMSPIAAPATGRLIGTPASMSASDDPQTDAMEDEPLDDGTSETALIVEGNGARGGRIAKTARPASAPCPISRRPGPRIGFTSPTENGGKL